MVAQIEAAIAAFNRDHNSATTPGSDHDIRLFAPTFVKATESPTATAMRWESPLTCQYMFLRATLRELQEFRAYCPLVNPVADLGARGTSAQPPAPSTPIPYLTLSDRAMDNFRRLAATLRYRIPIYRPGEIDLARTDEIEIIGGQFAGLRGRLLRQQGVNGGTVVFEIGNRLVASVANVNPRYIKVLAFAPGRKNAYELIDRFIRLRLRPALELWLSTGRTPLHPLTPEGAAVAALTARYGDTRITSPKLRAKLAALLQLSFTMMGDTAQADRHRRQLIADLPAVTNPVTLTLVHTYLYASTARPEHLQAALTAAASWSHSPHSQLETRILADLSLLQNHLK